MEDAATARRNAIATIDFERPIDEFLRAYLSPVPDAKSNSSSPS